MTPDLRQPPGGFQQAGSQMADLWKDLAMTVAHAVRVVAEESTDPTGGSMDISQEVEDLLADADTLLAFVDLVEEADPLTSWGDYWDAIHDALDTLPMHLRKEKQPRPVPAKSRSQARRLKIQTKQEE